tara:strand:+ start:80 stop:280 length:201 start_codon:yes stop_codon:yes gene_type:complete
VVDVPCGPQNNLFFQDKTSANGQACVLVKRNLTWENNAKAETLSFFCVFFQQNTFEESQCALFFTE